MKIKFRKSFEKDIIKIQDSGLLVRIKAVIEEVENAQNLLDVVNVKKLKADGNYYRIRVGEYPIGLVQDDKMITFVRFLHRKEIYRYFP